MGREGRRGMIWRDGQTETDKEEIEENGGKKRRERVGQGE